MAVAYRPARAADLERADALTVLSINDLTQRHGFAPMAAPGPTPFQLFSLNDDPDGLWVAEEAGRMLGFAFSWVCGDLWFLAQLFVASDQQGRGIGNELIQRTFEHARKCGANNKALITFAFNTVSQGLYIRHGFYPRFPIYFFGIERKGLIGRLQDTQLRCEAVENTPSDLARLTQIDVRSLGVSREKHHRYLLGENAARGAFFYEGDDCAGYAYVSADGHIGPLAVARRNSLGAALKAALRLAGGGGSSQVSAFLPGTSDTALSIAVEHGMRITFPMMLMSTHELADWTQYLPRNPGFI
jgi:ribosomal protein S18 acetylase RimI-like enzyme